MYVHCQKLNEVLTTGIVQAALSTGRRCYVPRVEDRQANMSFLKIVSMEDLQPAPPFGILEPQECEESGVPRENALQAEGPLDVLFMPGLAFDLQGGRLGRGGGYYDSFVTRCKLRAKEKGWAPPLLVALTFQCQMVEEVPMGGDDVHVDAVVTSEKIVWCSERGAAEGFGQ
ncbi:unnamed protein product [Ostreobium quekettii]|uniref:5-formyltetrahydrofolate cyclo-ligase n=1 Tax=Ostreobium quekettii TaxID=121088 RepID=A0A8S1IMV4_9CHLO|nr:unnamed protein product [Ostreobium quekettii]